MIRFQVASGSRGHVPLVPAEPARQSGKDETGMVGPLAGADEVAAGLDLLATRRKSDLMPVLP